MKRLPLSSKTPDWQVGTLVKQLVGTHTGFQEVLQEMNFTAEVHPRWTQDQGIN